MHRKARKAFGIIFLILAILSALGYGAIFFILNNKELVINFLTNIIKLPEEAANTLYNQYSSLLLTFKINILLPIFASFLFAVAILLFVTSCKDKTEKNPKQYNPFNLPKETYNLHHKTAPLLIIGFVGYAVSVAFAFVKALTNFAIFVGLGSFAVLFIAALFSGVVPISRGIKSRRIGDKYEIRVPKNSLLTGNFMPFQICTQLQKAYNYGFNHILYWEGYKGKTHIILSSSKFNQEQLEEIERKIKKHKTYPAFYSLNCLFSFKVEKDNTGMHSSQYHSIDRYLVTKRNEEPAYINLSNVATLDRTIKKGRLIFHFFGPDNKRLVDHDGNWCIAFVSGKKINLTEIHVDN